MSTIALLSAFFLILFAGRASAQDEKPGPRLDRKGFRALVQTRGPDFGPLEDGKEKSHRMLEKQAWVYLFDSRINPKGPAWDSLGLWRTRNADPGRNLWSVVEENGERVLRNTVGKDQHGTDLISKQNFFDFDLHAELRVPENSNSGVYLRGRYEIQILSTPAGRDRQLAPGDLGGIYNVRAPSVNASKGPGVWQTLDASIRGFRIVEVRLNGEVIHQDVEIPDERKKGTGSELSSGDGVSDDVNSPGPVFLQGDHGSVDFRNIRVRPTSGQRLLP